MRNSSIRCWMWSGKKQSVPIVFKVPCCAALRHGRLLISRVREEYQITSLKPSPLSRHRRCPTLWGIVQHHSLHFISTWTSTCCWSTRSCTHRFSHSETRDSNVRRLGQIRVRFHFWVHGIHLIPVSCISLCSTTFLFLSVRQR